MMIRLFERIGLLTLPCGKQGLHLLFWMQSHTAPSRSRTEGPSGADLTIAHGKLHFDQRFVCLLNECPTRTRASLWACDGLGSPIDGEVREVVAGLRLIPVGLERGTNQVHSMARLTLNQIGDRDISRIHEMSTWKQFLLSQVGMDGGDDSLIAQRSRSRPDRGNQLWSIFIATLS